MKNFAPFEIPGRIVCTTELNGATKVVIAATYKRRAREGGLEEDPHFNEITVFDAKDRRFIEDRRQTGDLVHVEGGVPEQLRSRRQDPRQGLSDLARFRAACQGHRPLQDRSSARKKGGSCAPDSPDWPRLQPLSFRLRCPLRADS